MQARFVYFLGFLAVAVLLLISLYLQFVKGFVPCPLCTMQRIAFAFLGIFFLVGLLIYAKRIGRIITNVFIGLTALGGLGFAARQIWLQNFPTPGGNECGVGLHYMVQALPLNEVMQKILAGDAECAERGWEFLFLNMAEWALVWFLIFLIMAFYLFLKEFKWNHR